MTYWLLPNPKSLKKTGLFSSSYLNTLGFRCCQPWKAGFVIDKYGELHNFSRCMIATLGNKETLNPREGEAANRKTARAYSPTSDVVFCVYDPFY